MLTLFRPTTSSAPENKTDDPPTAVAVALAAVNTNRIRVLIDYSGFNIYPSSALSYRSPFEKLYKQLYLQTPTGSVFTLKDHLVGARMSTFKLNHHGIPNSVFCLFQAVRFGDMISRHLQHLIFLNWHTFKIVAKFLRNPAENMQTILDCFPSRTSRKLCQKLRSAPNIHFLQALIKTRNARYKTVQLTNVNTGHVYISQGTGRRTFEYFYDKGLVYQTEPRQPLGAARRAGYNGECGVW